MLSATALPARPNAPALPTPDEDGTLRPYPKPASARTVSYSELNSLGCWLRHDLQYRQRLRPVARFAALQLGSAWDAFLNEWHAPSDPGTPTGRTEAQRWEASLDAATREIAREDRRVRAELADKGLPIPRGYDDPFEVTDFLTGEVVNRAGASQLRDMTSTILSMALHYRERYGREHDWRTLGVQVWFEVPFPSRRGGRASSKFWLRGCIDRVALHIPTGRVYVIDAKLRMGALNRDYREGFDNDLQLPLYGWALRQLGLECAGGLIDASAAKVPSWPELLAREVPCMDEHGEKIMDPELDESGEPVLYKSGPRKGEPKLKVRTRPALGANAHLGTSLPVFRAALDAHGLDKTLYGDQLYMLEAQWRGAEAWDGDDSAFHWRTDHDEAVFTDAALDRAIATMVGVGPYLDTLPPVPMPDKFRCKGCAFKIVCPEGDDATIAEHFTTPEQRDQLREQRRLEREEREATASPEALAVMDATADSIPW